VTPVTTSATSATDVGRVRDHNEDTTTVFVPSDSAQLAAKGLLAVVADGMGGFEAGEIASAYAVDALSKTYYSGTEPDPVRALLLGAQNANNAVRAIDAKRCGTTLVAAAVLGERLIVLNVGDSRAYLVSTTGIRQISQDHSWVEDQVRAGHLTAEQARTHPRRNVLTKAIGSGEYSEADIFEEALCNGCSVVLCSDGLHGLVTDEEIGEVVRVSTPQRAAMKLIELANQRGGHDNISVAIVHNGDSVGLESGYSTAKHQVAWRNPIPPKALTLALSLTLVAALGAVAYTALPRLFDRGEAKTQSGNRGPTSGNGAPTPNREAAKSTPVAAVDTSGTVAAAQLGGDRVLIVDSIGAYLFEPSGGSWTPAADRTIQWPAQLIVDATYDPVSRMLWTSERTKGSGISSSIVRGRFVAQDGTMRRRFTTSEVGPVDIAGIAVDDGARIAACVADGFTKLQIIDATSGQQEAPNASPVLKKPKDGNLIDLALSRLASPIKNATPKSTSAVAHGWIGLLSTNGEKTLYDGTTGESIDSGNYADGCELLAAGDDWVIPFKDQKKNFFARVGPTWRTVPTSKAWNGDEIVRYVLSSGDGNSALFVISRRDGSDTRIVRIPESDFVK